MQPPGSAACCGEGSAAAFAGHAPAQLKAHNATLQALRMRARRRLTESAAQVGKRPRPRYRAARLLRVPLWQQIRAVWLHGTRRAHTGGLRLLSRRGRPTVAPRAPAAGATLHTLKGSAAGSATCWMVRLGSSHLRPASQCLKRLDQALLAGCCLQRPGAACIGGVPHVQQRQRHPLRSPRSNGSRHARAQSTHADCVGLSRVSHAGHRCGPDEHGHVVLGHIG